MGYYWPPRSAAGRALSTRSPGSGTKASPPLEALLAALAELTADVRTREALANGLAFLIDLSDPSSMPTRSPVQPGCAIGLVDLLSDAISAGELVRNGSEVARGAGPTTYNGALITWAMYGEGAVEDYVRSQLEFLLGPWRQWPKRRR